MSVDAAVVTTPAVVPARASDATGEQGSTPVARRQWWFVRALERSPTFSSMMSGSRAFRTLMAGSWISMIGSRISTIAFPMLVLDLNNSPFIAGLVTFVAIVPSMLAYIPAGALVDRWNPWRVMLVTELLRGLAVAAVIIYILAFNDGAKVYWLMSFMVAEEILEIFWMLADRRYMSQLMERDKIAERQASIEVRGHAAFLTGRPIGPYLFTLAPFAPFLADALSFLVSVGTLIAIRDPVTASKRPAVASRRRLRREIAEGFQWLTENWHAGATMLLLAFTTLIAQALIMMFLAEAHDNKLSTVSIGVVLAASGVGGTVGSAIAKRLPGWIKRFWLQIQMCAWSTALCLLALSGVRLVWCIAAVMMILGLTGSIGNIQFGIYLVRNVHEGMLGRVIGIGQVLAIGAIGVGPLLGGTAIQRFGIQVAVELFLFLVLLMTFASFGVPWISRLTTGQDADEPGQVAQDSGRLAQESKSDSPPLVVNGSSAKSAAY